jgi:hypothetical protein
MRRWSLIVMCLLTSAIIAQAGAADSAPTPRETVWPLSITGFGDTLEKARSNGLKQIIKQIDAVLRAQNRPLIAWKPDDDYVKRHILDGLGEAGEDEIVEPERLKTWIYAVKPLDVAALRLLDQQAQRVARRQERVIIGLELFAGAVLVLTVLAGYLWLDGWMKGRYPRGHGVRK